jgi:hypothetical protein
MSDGSDVRALHLTLAKLLTKSSMMNDLCGQYLVHIFQDQSLRSTKLCS